MAKTKQRSGKGSATQRREQVHQQRATAQRTATQAQQTRTKNVRKRQSTTRSPWLLVGGILLMVAVVIGIFFFLQNQSTQTNTADATRVVNTLSAVPASTFAQVGTGTAQNLLKPIKGGPPLTGSTGKPEFLYIGGEYCPYCAAQRWGMITALSRFGTFSHVSTLTSYEDSVPTFSFHGSSYTSQYVDFTPVEESDNTASHGPLDQPTTAQQNLFNTYDAPPYVDSSSAGSIPFIDIANQYTSAGSYYMPDNLIGKSWDDIANQVKDPTTPISTQIVGTANYLTAAICIATQNQPASVCGAAPIPQIEHTLSTAYNGPNTQLASIGASLDMNTRRPD